MCSSDLEKIDCSICSIFGVYKFLWENQFPVKPVSVCALWERAIAAPQKKPISRFCVVPSLSQKNDQNLVYNYSCKRFEVLYLEKMKPYPPHKCVFLIFQKSEIHIHEKSFQKSEDKLQSLKNIYPKIF
mgnify:CR=1 FL=1